VDDNLFADPLMAVQLQREAMELNLANRIIIDHYRTPQGPKCVNKDCDSILTIEDRFSQCRQCVLEGRY
jgi:hypothetical protein